jgi:hypothetical protein
VVVQVAQGYLLERQQQALLTLEVVVGVVVFSRLAHQTAAQQAAPALSF